MIKKLYLVLFIYISGCTGYCGPEAVEPLGPSEEVICEEEVGKVLRCVPVTKKVLA